MKLTDGERTVSIRMMTYNGSGYSPDWVADFFDAGLLSYDDTTDTYTVPDVAYCIDAAQDWEQESEHNAVFIDEGSVKS